VVDGYNTISFLDKEVAHKFYELVYRSDMAKLPKVGTIVQWLNTKNAYGIITKTYPTENNFDIYWFDMETEVGPCYLTEKVIRIINNMTEDMVKILYGK
jgi:hypothetical protein